MRNVVKLIVGSAIGAGVGVALAKLASREAGVQPGEPTVPHKAPTPLAAVRERIERAREAGEAAREAREAELRAHFRAKVNDPTAMTDQPHHEP